MITLGDNTIGSDLPLGGRIRNLSVFQTGPIQASVRWDLEGEGKPYVYLNGYLAQQPAEGVASLSGLTEGSHNVSVISLAEHVRQPGFFYDLADGQRVRLRWPQADSTVAIYKVYGKSGGGDWTLIDEVTDRQVEELALAYPHSGTGAGKISVPSMGVDSLINLTMTLEITSPTTATYTYGAETGTTPVNPGGVSYLPHGVQATWHDPMEEYQVGDSWSIRIGLATEVLTRELQPGTWDFGVTAVSGAGWESSMLELPGQVFIPDYPEPVESAPIAYDEADEEFTITPVIPAGAVAVHLYTNFDTITGTYEPYVQEEVPLQVLTGAAVISLPTGDLKYYLWPVAASGAMLRDFTLHEVALPFTLEQMGIILSVPGDFTADLVAGDEPSYRLRWTYQLRQGDSIDHFRVMRTVPGGTPEQIATASWSDGTGSSPIAYDVTVTDAITWGDGPVELQVVACDASDSHLQVSDTVTVELITDAPGFGGTLEGGVA